MDLSALHAIINDEPSPFRIESGSIGQEKTFQLGQLEVCLFCRPTKDVGFNRSGADVSELIQVLRDNSDKLPLFEKDFDGAGGICMYRMPRLQVRQDKGAK